LANITVSALMREWHNETGNPRVSPVLNMGVSTLGLLTSALGALWLWKRRSCAIFLAVRLHLHFMSCSKGLELTSTLFCSSSRSPC
jgi:hypothetical protein